MFSLFSTVSIICIVCIFVFSNIGSDPEIYMTTPQIIEHWGYPAEIHNVITEDGYILELHRIPFGKNERNYTKRPIMFMEHGQQLDSSNFILNRPNQSPGFIFADAGFDIWLGNDRGNTYSRKHTTVNPDEKLFWKFTWDEIAKYDLDAMIKYVLNVTEHDSLYYMGYSQGTNTMFAKLATDEEFGMKMRKVFALGPVGSIKYMKGITSFFLYSLGDFISAMLDFTGSVKLLTHRLLLRLFSRIVCGNKIIGNFVCNEVFSYIVGPSSQTNRTRMQTYCSHSNSGSSAANFKHYVQMTHSGKLTMSDLGERQNLAKYGQVVPPEYNLTNIKVPLYLYWGTNDLLATEEDIRTYLLPRLNHTIAESHLLEGYNHMDFIWGLRAPQDIFFPIIELLKEDLNFHGNS